MKRRRVVDMAHKLEVKTRLRERLESYPEVRFAYLHGSFLDRERPGDLDVAVSLERMPHDVTSYELALEGALEPGSGLPVDVRVLEAAPLSFQYAVTRGEPLLVRDPEAWASFRERTWSAYLDFAPLREEALRDLTGRVLPSMDPDRI
jgi:hypothetical protein